VVTTPIGALSSPASMAASTRAQNASSIAKKLGPPFVRRDWTSASSFISLFRGLIEKKIEKRIPDVAMTEADCNGQSKQIKRPVTQAVVTLSAQRVQKTWHGASR